MAISISQNKGQGFTPDFSAPEGIYNNLHNLASPAKYASLYDFLNEVNAPDIRKELIKTFGNQGITGFLTMTGAVKNAGTADTVEWFEEARLHQIQVAVCDTSASATAAIIFDTVEAVDGGNYGTVEPDPVAQPTNSPLIVRVGDIILVNGVDRLYVSSVTVGTPGSFTAIPLTALSSGSGLPTGVAYEMPIVGNMFEQGSDQPNRFLQSNVVKRTNPYAIVKEVYEVSGSQATNLGYIDLGNGDYRFYVKGEMDTRQRFMDKREMTLLLGQQITNGAITADIDGTEGYFAALENRGMVTSGLVGSTTGGFSDIDALIKEMDKNGCPSEYALYVNTTQDLLLDDMIANGYGSATTGGIAGSYGAFNNDRDMALNLGFKSFTRGGYTFHKHSWKLLNDPTLLGNDDVAQNLVAGVAIPLAKVADAKSGAKSPALEMCYKAAGGYSREMEHWVTGGGVLGFTNDTFDIAKFHYRSEVCLVTRAANQHVLIQGI
jgi:hypothetical protein